MAGHLAWGVALEERPYDECHLVSEYRRREEERGKRGGEGARGRWWSTYLQLLKLCNIAGTFYSPNASSCKAQG